MKSLLSFLAMLGIALTAGVSRADVPKNFVKVSDGIYRGARPSLTNLQTLASMGVRLDINLQGGDLTNPLFGLFAKKMEPGEQPAAIRSEKAAAARLGMKSFNAPLDCFDRVNVAEDALIDQTLELLERASAQSPVYLHCEHGKDRTGLVIALYRVKHDRWSPEAAFAEWERLGHSDVNQFMLHHLDNYFWSKIETL